MVGSNGTPCGGDITMKCKIEVLKELSMREPREMYGEENTSGSDHVAYINAPSAL